MLTEKLPISWQFITHGNSISDDAQVGITLLLFFQSIWVLNFYQTNRFDLLPIQNMPRRFLYLFGILIICIVIGVGILISRARVFAAPEQPVSYSHKTHVSNGIQCLYCHVEVTRSEIAGIPSMEKCMGCHNFIATKDESIKVIIDYWERGEPIPWKRVNVQPDFVYFNHQRHTLSGLNCETCHGFVGNMDEAKSVVKMDMGWCIKCHLEQSEEKVAHLVDCLACHK